jgi:2-hydroxy-4-carboxymuconate semialdehyde hemiacetal dehydrogenase
MKILMAGQGAFGVKHLEGLMKIPDVEVVSLIGGSPDTTRAVAEKFKIPHWSTDLAEGLKQPGLDACILTTPTGMHAAQGIQCMEAGKHVEIEIPMADNLAD